MGMGSWRATAAASCSAADETGRPPLKLGLLRWRFIRMLFFVISAPRCLLKWFCSCYSCWILLICPSRSCCGVAGSLPLLDRPSASSVVADCVDFCCLLASFTHLCGDVSSGCYSVKVIITRSVTFNGAKHRVVAKCKLLFIYEKKLKRYTKIKIIKQKLLTNLLLHY